MVGDFNRLHVETMHSFVNQLSMLLVTTVDIQLVLSSAIQSASINATYKMHYRSLLQNPNNVLATFRDYYIICGKTEKDR